MEHRINKAAAESFAEAFAGALSASLTQIVGSPWALEVAEHRNPPAADTQPLPFLMKVEGGLRGECFIEFYEPQLSELIAKLNTCASDPDAANDRANALILALTAAATRLKSSLSAQFGEVTFKLESVSGLACGGMFVVPLRVQARETSPPFVFIYFDGVLLNSLSAATAAEEPADPAAPAGSQIHPSNLRLVMDVELNVSLRFGRRQLPLREVLELASGSVIELDRMVDDPVEMLLDGKVVARGEAVIVDGNYGLRVTEIPQALESHLSCR